MSSSVEQAHFIRSLRATFGETPHIRLVQPAPEPLAAPDPAEFTQGWVSVGCGRARTSAHTPAQIQLHDDRAD
jgi:hypothetical protein